MWRPVLEGTITYSEMCTMHDEELAEINAAIDYYIELINKDK